MGGAANFVETFFRIHGQTELRGRFDPDQVKAELDGMVRAEEILAVRDGKTTWYAFPRNKK